MNYYESAEGVIISPERAKKEIEKHNACWLEFLEDVGDNTIYDAQVVLAWLWY